MLMPEFLRYGGGDRRWIYILTGATAEDEAVRIGLGLDKFTQEQIFCPSRTEEPQPQRNDQYRGKNNGLIGCNNRFRSLISGNDKYKILKRVQINNPSVKVDYAEPWPESNTNIVWAAFMQYRHALKSSILFIDCHVRQFRPNETQDDPNFYP
jgi:hypothetical protein